LPEGVPVPLAEKEGRKKRNQCKAEASSGRRGKKGGGSFKTALYEKKRLGPEVRSQGKSIGENARAV